MQLALPLAASLAFLCVLGAADGPAYRTDAAEPGSPGEKLPWFEVKQGEFPPEGSAHSIAGELIALDHVNRTGALRPDRTDAQRRDDWDLPLPFAMLPYGSIRYRGAPAELRDVAIGTHLHGMFYAGAAPPHQDPNRGRPRRQPVDAKFGRVLRFEDDFSRSVRLKRSWRVDSIDPAAGTLIVTGTGEGGDDAKPTKFEIGPYARVWKGRGFGAVADVTAGQNVLLNLTVCTLKGPGRVTDVWVDPESSDLAVSQQLEVHRRYQREHGLAGIVDEVDDEKGTITVTLFDGVDPALLKEFVVNEFVTTATAEESLRTWDQINDRKGGAVKEIMAGPLSPGSSGMRIRVKPDLMLEGFRPKRVVRLWAAKWKVDDLPREEALYE